MVVNINLCFLFNPIHIDLYYFIKIKYVTSSNKFMKKINELIK